MSAFGLFVSSIITAFFLFTISLNGLEMVVYEHLYEPLILFSDILYGLGILF
jgi:hypothetical protein